ncbi:hypothetical protein QTP88_025990 [Uroleucon formosanum]
MMNAHFQPLIPLYASSPPSNVLTVCTSFVSGSTGKPHTKSECQQLSSDNSSIVINEKSRKRKCCPRVNDRIKKQKHREAVKKYADKYLKVNRKAIKRYNNANPDVHRVSVSSTIDYYNDKVVSIEQPTEYKWCHAKKWKEESPGICCSNGKVVLPLIETLPEPLHSLLLNNHPESKHFLTNIRKYNGYFQMTSFGTKTVNVGGFTPTFKIQGQVYHRIGSVLPSYANESSFLQIYFVGNDEKEVELQSNLFPTVKPRLVGQLQKMLHNHNQYVRDFKTAFDCVPKG